MTKNKTPLTELLSDIDEEIAKVQNSLISESDYQKLLNSFENDYVSNNSRMLSVAGNLSEDYVLYHNTNQINDELNDYRKISRQEIMDVAKKYLNKDQRVVLYYLPKSK